MNERMEFPETFDEFAKQYGFTDTEEIYTNGSELIPVFRVKQWLEHINKPTQMIDKSNFDERQYRADIDSAYDCGRNSVFGAIEDIKNDIEQHCNITIGSDNEPAMTLYDIFGILDKHIYRKEKVNESNN